MSITTDVQQLAPGSRIQLFELDASAFGGPVLRFHNDPQGGRLTWKGVQYEAWAIEATDFERNGTASQASPTLRVGNIGKTATGEVMAGVIGALCLEYQDFVGAIITVRETFSKYLDAANWPGGNPGADPTQELPLEVWTVQQRSLETAEMVEFEMSSALSFDGRQLPARQVMATMCPWKWIGGYRGEFCQYMGGAYFDAQDQPVAYAELDKCGGRPNSCRVRFAAQQGVKPVEAVINFGGFPAADRMR